MQKLELGTYADGSDFYFYDQFLGDAYGILSMTGYGKSIMGGNIITELAHQRPCIIFDYRGDYKNLRYFNFSNMQQKQDAITDMVYIEKFGFKVSDFTNPFDWEMVGMTSNGAQICAAKARAVSYHHNNFDKFLDMVRDIKVFGSGDEGETFRMTKHSMISKLQKIKYAFVEDKNSVDITDKPVELIRYSGVPLYISDWKAFFEKHRHICLNMNSDTSPAKAKLFVGKIMNEIEPIMKKLKPVILLEESHVLCPEIVDDLNLPYSMIKILHYLKELHKDGVKLILITQYPHQLKEDALDEIKHFFIGKLQNVKGSSKLDEIFKESMKLNYNYKDNYREFMHYSAIYNQKDVFIPYDSFSLYEKRI